MRIILKLQQVLGCVLSVSDSSQKFNIDVLLKTRMSTLAMNHAK